MDSNKGACAYIELEKDGEMLALEAGPNQKCALLIQRLSVQQHHLHLVRNVGFIGHTIIGTAVVAKEW